MSVFNPKNSMNSDECLWFLHFLLLNVHVEEGGLHQTCVPIKVKLYQPVIPSMATPLHCND